MQQVAALVAFGVAFIVMRFATVLLFQQIAPPPPGVSRWQWWGTYVSILISLMAATWVLGLVDRRMNRPVQR
jgi:hypothetical protein